MGGRPINGIVTLRRSRSWLRGCITESWVVAVVLATLGIAGTGIGGFALMGARSDTPTQSGQAVPGPTAADIHELLPGNVRILGTRWAHFVRGGSPQFEVRYGPHVSNQPKSLAVLAYDHSAKQWVTVFNGPQPPSNTDVLVPTGSTEEAQFAEGLIYAIDTRSGGKYAIPQTQANIALIEEWMAHEGGLWADNPLNTSLDAAVYPHQITSGGEDTGIPIYPSLQTGIENTAATLLGNSAYEPILAALATGAGDCLAFASAVVESPWAAGHYGYDPGSFCPDGSAPAPATPSEVSVAAPSEALQPGRPRHLHRGHRQHTKRSRRTLDKRPAGNSAGSTAESPNHGRPPAVHRSTRRAHRDLTRSHLTPSDHVRKSTRIRGEPVVERHVDLAHLHGAYSRVTHDRAGTG